MSSHVDVASTDAAEAQLDDVVAKLLALAADSLGILVVRRRCATRKRNDYQQAPSPAHPILLQKRVCGWQRFSFEPRRSFPAGSDDLQQNAAA
jgi:hypothetical protein